MVAAVRAGESLRAVSRRFGVALSTVQFWVARADGKRLDRVDWSDRPSGPRHSPERVRDELEERIVQLRKELKADSDLGYYGASAIRDELVASDTNSVPCERTVHRVLERRGALDGRRRVRYPRPPTGWYLPEVAAGRAELDQADIVEGLKIKDGPQVEVLTCLSLLGGLAGAWPETAYTAQKTRETLLAHWRRFGLPDYAQFDNDTRFQGPHQHPDTVGSVTRLCLSLGVTPVFAPPAEMGFQAAIESFNGRWQTRVWARFQHDCLEALQTQSDKYTTAYRARSAARRGSIPSRRRVPEDWQLDLQAHPQGALIYLRRSDDAGRVRLLGHTFDVSSIWPHRLVRCEVLLDEHRIDFYQLRRRAPTDQPLLNSAPYKLPQRRFRE
jgi:transposase-like protein